MRSATEWVTRVMVAVYIVVWVAFQVMHFSQGYQRGLLNQTDHSKMAERCLEDEFLRRQIPDKCTEALASRGMSPMWNGLVHVGTNLSFCGFTSCTEIVQTLGIYAVFAALSLVVILIGISYVPASIRRKPMQMIHEYQPDMLSHAVDSVYSTYPYSTGQIRHRIVDSVPRIQEIA